MLSSSISPEVTGISWSLASNSEPLVKGLLLGHLVHVEEALMLLESQFSQAPQFLNRESKVKLYPSPNLNHLISSRSIVFSRGGV